MRPSPNFTKINETFPIHVILKSCNKTRLSLVGAPKKERYIMGEGWFGGYDLAQNIQYSVTRCWRLKKIKKNNQ